MLQDSELDFMVGGYLDYFDTLVNTLLNDQALSQVGLLKVVLNSTHDFYHEVPLHQLSPFLEQDFSHPRFDIKEQKDFTWL
jgi:hypothetical protein